MVKKITKIIGLISLILSSRTNKDIHDIADSVAARIDEETSPPPLSEEQKAAAEAARS